MSACQQVAGIEHYLNLGCECVEQLLNEQRGDIARIEVFQSLSRRIGAFGGLPERYMLISEDRCSLVAPPSRSCSNFRVQEGKP